MAAATASVEREKDPVQRMQETKRQLDELALKYADVSGRWSETKIQSVADALSLLGFESVLCLRDVMRDATNPATARIRASQAILDNMIVFRSAADLEARVIALELANESEATKVEAMPTMTEADAWYLEANARDYQPE